MILYGLGIVLHKKGRYIMNNWWITLVQQIITSISPQLRNAVVEFVNKLEVDAKKTVDNPWDDVFVGILKLILVIK